MIRAAVLLCACVLILAHGDANPNAELESWIGELLPSLPTLTELRPEFEAFYKVTAVRKFLFFLDAPRKGRISVRAILSSPILHELFELRRQLSAEVTINYQVAGLVHYLWGVHS